MGWDYWNLGIFLIIVRNVWPTSATSSVFDKVPHDVTFPRLFTQWWVIRSQPLNTMSSLDTHRYIYIYTHIYIHCVKLCREGEIERERADVTDGGTSFNIPFFEGTEGEQWAQAGLRCHHQTGLAKKAPTSNRSPVDRCSEYTIFTHTIRSYIQSCV